jgi:hypothetical protein
MNLISPEEIEGRAKRGRRERWKEEREAYLRENGPKRPSPQNMSQEVFKQTSFEKKFTRFWRPLLSMRSAGELRWKRNLISSASSQ